MTKTLKPRKAVRFDAAAVKAGKAKIPSRALRFDASVDIGTAPAADGTVPLTVVARSGKVVDHWYFGRIVHDFAGMRPASPQLPFDYCHDENQVLGFASSIDASSGELVVSGVLIPFTETDRASEVIFKSSKKFQYQASIYFDPQELVLEYVPEGFTAEVNGAHVEGPIVIARSWMLRGVALCPYGQDPNTSVQFSLSQPGDLVAVSFNEAPPMTKKTKLSAAKPNRHERRKATALSAKKQKATTKLATTTPAKKDGKAKTKFDADASDDDDDDAEGQQSADDEDDDEVEDPTDTEEAEDAEDDDCDCAGEEGCDCDDEDAEGEDDPVDEMDSDDEEGQQATKHSAKSKGAGKTKLTAKKGKTKLSAAAKEVKKFVTAFGPQGGVWLSEGRTFEEARTLFTSGLTKKNAELEKKVTEQAAQLSALRGETEPVSGGSDGKPAAAPANGLTAGQAKFAATFKIKK